MNFAIAIHMYYIHIYIYLAQRSQGKLLYTKFSDPCLIYVHVLSHWNTGLLHTWLFLIVKHIKSSERRGLLFQYILGFSWFITSMVKKWWLFCVTLNHSARWLFSSQSLVPDFHAFLFHILAAVTQVQIWVFIVAREAFCAVALIPLPGKKGWLPQQIVPVSVQVRL